MGCGTVGSPTDVHRGKRRTVAPPDRRLTVGRGVALPLSVPLPSLGRQQSGRHWRCAFQGGRGPPYHSGSCSPGFSGYDLCGVPVRRRGPACSSRPPCEPAAGAGGRVTLRLPSRPQLTCKPPLCPLGVGCGYGRVMRGAASFVFRCARCSGTPVWVRGSRSSRRCPYRVAVPPVGGGVPPALGGRRAAPSGSPAGVGAGGGGGGAAPPPALGPVWEGGGGVGGGLWSPGDASCRPRGGGRLGSPGPGGQPSARGVAPFPRPPLPRAGFSRSPSLGPLIPRPLSRGAGRPGVAVRVSGQWLAGCGAAGFPPRLLSPHSLPREVARRFPWVGNKAGVTGVVLTMGGVAPHTIPVRAHPASLGTICAASRCAGVGPLVLRGPQLSRRLGRGGGSHSGSPLGRGGSIPPASGGGSRGPRGWRAGEGAGGGGCRAAASLLSFRAAACGTPFRLSPCRRRAPFRRARAVGAEMAPRGWGG